MVPDEESLAGGEDNVAVFEQVKLDDDSAVPDLNKVVPDENQWVDPEPVNSTLGKYRRKRNQFEPSLSNRFRISFRKMTLFSSVEVLWQSFRSDG